MKGQCLLNSFLPSDRICTTFLKKKASQFEEEFKIHLLFKQIKNYNGPFRDIVIYYSKKTFKNRSFDLPEYLSRKRSVSAIITAGRDK